MVNRIGFAALALFLHAAPVAAQDKGEGQAKTPEAPTMVSATDANGVLAAVRAAGFDDVELIPRDGESSTSIRITNEELNSFVLFSDCDEAIPDFCETLVLSTSWNRNVPISDAAIAKANYTNKYVSVWRDEDGDPVMQWAILTRRDGIPSKVFAEALTRYLGIAQNYWDVAFEGDEDEKDDSEKAPPVEETASA